MYLEVRGIFLKGSTADLKSDERSKWGQRRKNNGVEETNGRARERLVKTDLYKAKYSNKKQNSD